MRRRGNEIRQTRRPGGCKGGAVASKVGYVLDDFVNGVRPAARRFPLDYSCEIDSGKVAGDASCGVRFIVWKMLNGAGIAFEHVPLNS